ncbi:MAG: WbqC family protein [Aureibaculum sp.]
MLLYPTYFSPIAHYIALVKVKKVVFEVEDNYQKQTYRTRCYIYGANGRQLLNIPVKHTNKSRKTKDIKIDGSFSWEKQHLKAMQAAYRSSPFFEYFEEDLIIFFKNTPTFLLDLNIKVHELMMDFLQLDLQYNRTTEYVKDLNGDNDYRFLANAKSNKIYGLSAYTQVFSNKFGFIENLSILDLLFMEGTNALNYLQNQQIENP